MSHYDDAASAIRQYGLAQGGHAEAHALLAVADELRGIRELLGAASISDSGPDRDLRERIADEIDSVAQIYAVPTSDEDVAYRNALRRAARIARETR